MAIIPTYLFGHPRQGLRQIRIPIIDWSFIDTILTLIAAKALTRVSWASKDTLANFAALLIIGGICHRLAGLDLY